MSADSPLHGEYKVPGGKLVVVDLTIDGDRIASIRIAGDFFVEPDETIAEMERAVLGMRADSDAGSLTQALADAVSRAGALEETLRQVKSDADARVAEAQMGVVSQQQVAGAAAEQLAAAQAEAGAPGLIHYSSRYVHSLTTL